MKHIKYFLSGAAVLLAGAAFVLGCIFALGNLVGYLANKFSFSEKDASVGFLLAVGFIILSSIAYEIGKDYFEKRNFSEEVEEESLEDFESRN